MGIISGDLSQFQREKVLGAFKKHQVNLLIATDVAARGIDVNDITHVINYELPETYNDYIHKNGSVTAYDADVWFSYELIVQPGDSILVLGAVDTKYLQAVKDITQIIYQIAVGAAVVIRY